MSAKQALCIERRITSDAQISNREGIMSPGLAVGARGRDEFQERDPWSHSDHEMMATEQQSAERESAGMQEQTAEAERRAEEVEHLLTSAEYLIDWESEEVRDSIDLCVFAPESLLSQGKRSKKKVILRGDPTTKFSSEKI